MDDMVYWNIRNSILFIGHVAGAVEIFVLIQIEAWSWITNKYSKMEF